jgi:hypothetical protein
MSWVLVWLTLVATIATRAADGQTPATGPADPPTALILGRVVDGMTDRPMPNLIVTLTGGGSVTGPGSPAQPRRVITDSNGRFLFHDLAAGKYGFSLQNASGAVLGGYGMRRPGGAAQLLDLAAGERAGDLTVRAWKYASVGGTLIDASGEPIVETRVGTLQVDFIAGRRRYRAGPTAMTDDRGVFRIANLPPGEYVVFVPYAQVTIPAAVQAAYDEAGNGGQVGRSEFQRSIPGVDTIVLNGSGPHIGDLILVRQSNVYGADGPMGTAFTSPPPDDQGHLLVYPFTYYPSATQLGNATTIVLEAGQERGGLELQARLVPAMRVSGHVTGPDGPAAMVGVRLVPQSATDVVDESAIEAATTVTNTGGDFTFLGVPAGQYTLKIARVPNNTRPSMGTSISVGGTTMFTAPTDSNLPPLPVPETPTLTATVPVVVGDRDVTGLNVTLATGARVSGHVEYDGSSPKLTEDQLLRAGVTLDPADGRTFTGATGRGQFDASGQFKTFGIVPGRYLLRPSGNLGTWVLRSVTVGGRDIADAPLTVEGTDLTNVVVTLTDRPAGVGGTVRDRAGAPDATARVLLFPADRERWTDTSASPRRIKSSRTSARGAYDLGGLLPGDYLIIAIDDQFSENWQDPKRLDALARTATRVTITPGQHAAMDLKAETVR